ncbi:glycoside hydrolase family 20 zincin-like fold domain-containing protein [Chryseolinea sp. H1M3-3]|uniref:glycoside hydrolase family 20 zincin-like fold domain-containing protein n=1 Tax=Chryseolinea sp. H1M3-3 TaxID=3034144 RepID=UPI0023ED10CD|nr:glycoside hydrolase family 20 zincin-like fold domain-containing protein [Chryseolinea sp. H1M3-3]
MKRTSSLIFLLLFAHILAAQVMLDYPKTIRGIELAMTKVKKALHDSKYQLVESPKKPGGYIIKVIVEQNKNIGPEGYRLETKDNQITISASDASGARYGSLAFAEQLENKKELRKITSQAVNPTFAVRTIKFNLPWEPYRESRSMEYHLSTCRDLNFWESYLNMMFENRFNVLALYNMHPFPYMVKLANYPEACPFSDKEMDDWKTFWKNLFRMAKDRGIDVYIVNWNIVVPKAFAEKHNVPQLNDTSAITKEYTHESVLQVINEYEELGGIGVTLADWMNNMDAAQREDWIEDTFVKAMHRAKRKTKFMHRAVLSGSPVEMRRVIDAAKLPDPVLVEVKFNWSHGHSTPYLALTHDNTTGTIDKGFWSPEPKNYKIQWMVRNEDFWILRWGEPDFIRKHIEVNAKSYVDGYHIGSEGYIPAFDYFTKTEIGKTWHYAFERQWLFYQMWGRLLYDKHTPDDIFESTFNRKYNFSDGKKLLDAFRLVSRMPLRLASFFASTWDYTLYSEGFLSPRLPAGDYGSDDGHSLFISIDELIDRKALDPHYLSIKDYAQHITQMKKIPAEKTDPITLAQELAGNADSAGVLLKSLRTLQNNFNSEYRQELDDIETWALLSQYFATKLRAGVSLQLYRTSGKNKDKETAIEYLETCLKIWKNISELTDRNYYEVPYFKSNVKEDNPEIDSFSWKKYLPEVERDIQIARQSY